tara:strand:- start:87 stop:317 length:231 start_codon:yes stop_codon:yes gene_type:complete
MNKKEVLKNLYEELEIDSVDELSLGMNYKNLEEWDSMSVIIVIGFFEEHFSITISGEILNKLSTFDEIFTKLNIHD